MVTLLERIYWTRSAVQRPMQAAKIQQIETRRKGDIPADCELQQFLRGVFNRLENALAIEEETNNGR